MLVLWWVLLGLKEKVKVPENVLEEVISWCRVEPHLQEDRPELGVDLCKARRQRCPGRTLWAEKL